MTVTVNYNAAAQQAYSNLTFVNRMLQQSAARLSSGVRVNSAADDPAALVLSNSLRHQITGIKQATQNIEEGVSMVQTADGAADNMSALLTRIRSLALKAANVAPTDAAQLVATQAELDQAIDSITRIATDTRFGTVKLLQGNFGDNTVATASKTFLSSVTHDATRMPGGITEGSTITLQPPVTGSNSPGHTEVTLTPGTAATTALTGLTQNGVALSTAVVGNVLNIIGPSGSAAITLDVLTVTDTLQGVIDAINTATTTTGVAATYNQTTGKLGLNANASGPFQVAVDQAMGAGGVALFDTVAGTTASALALNGASTTPQRGHAGVMLDGRPAVTAPLVSLSQNGTQFSGSMTAGTQLTVVGPRGAATTLPLTTTTTIGEVLNAINTTTATTGVTAHYDQSTGNFSVDAEGPGNFSVSVNNAMETGGSAFLDSSAGTSAVAVAGNTFITNTSDLRHERVGVVMRTATGAVPSATTTLQGLRQNGTPLSAVGGSLTIGGVVGSQSIALSSTMTLDDLVSRINAVTAQTGVRAAFDATTGDLALENTGFGHGILTAKASQDMSGGSNVALLDLNPASSSANPLQEARDVFSMTMVNRSNGTTATVPSVSDSIAGLEGSGTIFNATGGKQLTIFGPDGTQDSMTMTAPATGTTLAAWVGTFAQTATDLPVTWDATASTLTVTGTSGAATPIASPFAVTASTTAQEIAAYINQFNVVGTTPNLSGLALTASGGQLSTAYTSTLAIPAFPPATATTSIGGTTIQDVLDFINRNPTVANVSASYNSTSGALSVTTAKGSFNIVSDQMTTGSNAIGLLDANTNSISDAGWAKTASAKNATMTAQFVDSSGVTRSVLLTQQAASGNGTSFVNLNAGPELTPPFTGWQAGAFSVTVKDATAGVMGASLTVATTDQTATRVSTAIIQSGGLAGQTIGIEIADLRAGALGYSAIRTQLASSDPNKSLLTKQLFSLQDLKDRKALVNGNAQEAITVIDAAIDELNTVRGRLGAIQADSLETTSASLQQSFNNLSDSESRLRDTDFAWESTQYAKYNTIYQAATAMLTQANQIPNTVLQMLKG